MSRAIAPTAAVAAAALAGLAGCPGGGGGTDPRTPGAARDGLTLTYYIDRKFEPRAPEAGFAVMPAPTPIAEDTTTRLVVVEQRQWVDVVAGQTLDLERIDDGADLESLVIEPLAGGGLELGTCARDSVVSALRAEQTMWVGRQVEIVLDGGATAAGTIAAIRGDQLVLVDAAGATTAVSTNRWRAIRLVGGDSLVRCLVTSGEGRRLVRVVYTTTALGFHAEHTMRVALAADGTGTAEITPRFTVDTPAWQLTADVALYDGMPGGARAPREVFRGPVTLTGESVVVAAPMQRAAARLEAVYRGAIPIPNEAATDPYWRQQSTLDVWDWLTLDLGDATLPPGRITMEIARAGDAVPEPAIAEPDALELVDPADRSRVRIKLWPVPELRGSRMKTNLSSVTSQLRESILFAISNSGDRPRDVIIEEELRPARTRAVLRPFPKKPTVRDGVLRIRLRAMPGAAAHAGYVLDYQF
jgi:hypothetical protein